MNTKILTTAIDRINDLQNIQCRIEEENLRNEGSNDAKICLTIGQREIFLDVKIKRKVVPAQIPNITYLKEVKNPPMIIAQYITPRAKEMLVEEQIAYADMAGNMFLFKDAIFILVDNGKRYNDKNEKEGRAFTAAGLKVVYQFLIRPENINKPYRFIGKRAGVTIGTVGKALKGLNQNNFVIKENERNYFYRNLEKLLLAWVTEYNRTLKPKLEKRKFRWKRNINNWSKLKLPEDTQWGGPAAAAILTQNLIADKWIVYTSQNFVKIMENLPLVPNKDGRVEVVRKFWVDPTEVEVHFDDEIVHPILVYADLIEESNSRYVDAAKTIYKDYIEPIL